MSPARYFVSRGGGNAARCAAMSLRRCVSSLGCAELSLDATLALATKHGVAAVELRALGGTVDLAGYFAAQFGTPANLAAWLRERGATGASVEVVALNASLHLVGATAAERNELVALAPWAEAAGARWLRVFDGGREADAAEIADAAEALAWWRDMREKNGWRVDVMVETHDSLFTAERIGRLLATAPGTAILWDAHHTWRKGGEDPAATWAAIRGAVVHVHVKDSIAVPSARHPFTYVLPGDGGFPMATARSVLERDGFSGCVSLEWEKMWHPYLPGLDAALLTAERRGWW